MIDYKIERKKNNDNKKNGTNEERERKTAKDKLMSFLTFSKCIAFFVNDSLSIQHEVLF